MDLIIAAIIGLMAGLHTSTWGMYKDAPHEGFTWPKYFRSTVIGTATSVIIYLVTKLDMTHPGNMVVLSITSPLKLNCIGIKYFD